MEDKAYKAMARLLITQIKVQLLVLLHCPIRFSRDAQKTTFSKGEASQELLFLYKLLCLICHFKQIAVLAKNLQFTRSRVPADTRTLIHISHLDVRWKEREGEGRKGR